jgi:glycerophosphoryl diester phosphodiesterase
MLELFQRPIILAHRGDSAHAPENTLPAFSQAIQKGVDGIELDGPSLRSI